MQATFGIQREVNNKLFFNSYNNVTGKFHFHSQLEIFFVDEGEVNVFINDKTKCLKAGEISVTLSYDAHLYKSLGNSRSSLLIIPPHMCGDFITEIKNKRIENPFITDKDAVAEIRECFDKIKVYHNNKLRVEGYIYVIFGILMDKLSLKERLETTNTSLGSKLLLYINENYKKNISLASIAHAIGYNPSYISRYFKDTFDIGINQYINIVRLKNAVILMRNGKSNITYCALESGFNSMSTFYRTFYDEFGCAPKDFFLEK